MLNFQSAFFVILGGGLGSLARYAIASQLNQNQGIPVGTFCVNVTGSFLLAFLLVLQNANVISQGWLTFFGTGFLGAFTTMSTFGTEAITYNEGAFSFNILYFVITTVGVLLGVLLGYFIGKLVVS